MERSNDVIKDLSMNVFEVISFYKELLEVWGNKQSDIIKEVDEEESEEFLETK
jgi:hypothetical protein